LVAPSANLFGTVSPTEPAHVLKNFNGQIPYILNGGPCRVGIESTVVGFDAAGLPVIYRHGAVTAEAIRSVTGSVSEIAKASDTVSPGMLPYHYSPRTPLRFGEEVDTEHLTDVQRIGAIRFQSYHSSIPVENQFILSPVASMAEAAQNLYKALHTLDDLGLDIIYAERLPDDGLGKALNDRLQKAANQFEPKKPWSLS
jgi:L-threonylcarbamoyladenylate synthase